MDFLSKYHDKLSHALQHVQGMVVNHATGARLNILNKNEFLSMYSNLQFLKGYLVNWLEHFFLYIFCLQIKFPQLFAMFSLLSCINTVFVTSMPARGAHH
jgi:hypothetical protein